MVLRLATFVLVACHASYASAATLRAWTAERSFYIQTSPEEVLLSRPPSRVEFHAPETLYFFDNGGFATSSDNRVTAFDDDGFGTADLNSGELAGGGKSGPNFDKGGGGAYVSVDPQAPLFVNTSSSPQPVQISLNLFGFYTIPEVEFAGANSGISALVKTSEGSSEAIITHSVGYINGEYRNEVLERTSNTGNTSRDGGSTTIEQANENSLLASVSTALLFIPPGEGAGLFYSLSTGASNGGEAFFGNTAYMSIFIDDRNAFSIDPRISSWVYEFGEEGNGPDTGPHTNPVPLPASLPLLLAAFAGMAGLRRFAIGREQTDRANK